VISPINRGASRAGQDLGQNEMIRRLEARVPTQTVVDEEIEYLNTLAAQAAAMEELGPFS